MKTECVTHAIDLVRAEYIPAMAAIARQTAHPWDEDAVRACLHPYHHTGVVCVNPERRSWQFDYLLGYCLWRVGRRHLEILTMGVEPRFRRQKVGRDLVVHVLSKLRWDQQRSVRADVPERCLDAQVFLKACGFVGKTLSPDAYRFSFALSGDDYPDLLGKDDDSIL